MARVIIQLDDRAFRQLIESADRDRRDLRRQAEHLLTSALGVDTIEADYHLADRAAPRMIEAEIRQPTAA